MKHFIIPVLLMFSLLAGCAGNSGSGKAADDAPLTAGLVFNIGGRGDKGINDLAYNGLVLARKKYGIDFLSVEPGGEGGDREAALRQMAADPDVDLVIGVGMLFSEDIVAIAKMFPEKKFVSIDFRATPGLKLPDNLSGMVFEERKGSFLVGALAALSSKNRNIGFIGGMDSPIIRKFQEGYVAGARHIDPDITIISAYIGMTGKAFADPAKGKELAIAQYGRGVDIIYQAAGASGLGVTEAARNNRKLVIETDYLPSEISDQSILTSMTKAVDRAVLKTVGEVIDGTFKGGRVTVFGLDGRYTDYIYNDMNTARIPPEVHDRIEQIRSGILSGAIRVDDNPVVR